jgi:sulfite reductase alpha subunit-like flavoprotein
MDQSHHREVLILFGTQTGNAQEVAEHLSRELRRRFFRTKVLSMDEYNIVHFFSSIFLDIRQ